VIPEFSVRACIWYEYDDLLDERVGGLFPRRGVVVVVHALWMILVYGLGHCIGLKMAY
jgi:hypothetical protein